MHQYYTYDSIVYTCGRTFLTPQVNPGASAISAVARTFFVTTVRLYISIIPMIPITDPSNEAVRQYFTYATYH